MEKAANTTPPRDVAEYLHTLPEAVQITLEKVRQTIRAAAPTAEEVISYQIPTYKHKGALVHFAAFKHHCSFFVVSKNIFKKFANELAPYKTSGTTIHFTPDHPLPPALIRKIVTTRLTENEARQAVSKSKSK